jgi:Domain of unknown function (DUF4386)
MDSSRRAAVSAGVLFVTATLASLLATGLSQPVLSATDYLASASARANQLSAAALFDLIAAGASAGIAIAMYPVLKQWHASLALGSVVFRTIEAVMYSVGPVSVLSVMALGQQLTGGASADRAAIQAIGDALLALRQQAALVGVFAFSAGALMYYGVLYQSRLIPRWLSGWGVVAIILMLAACVLALFTHSPVTSYVVLALPIAIQEMVLAVWLIVRGFSASAVRPGTARRLSAAVAS